MNQPGAAATPTSTPHLTAQEPMTTDQAQEILGIIAVISVLIDHFIRVLWTLASHNWAIGRIKALEHIAIVIASLLIAFDLKRCAGGFKRYPSNCCCSARSPPTLPLMATADPERLFFSD